MTDNELKMLGDLLEKLVRKEALADSERLAAIRLANAADQLAAQRKKAA